MAAATGIDYIQICTALWSWDLCAGCLQQNACQGNACPVLRIKRLSRHLDYCRVLFAAYESESSSNDPRRLFNYAVDAITLIRSNPKDTRSELMEKMSQSAAQASSDELDRALAVAVKLMFMINCGYDSQSLEIVEPGSLLRPWTNGSGLNCFILDSFPRTNPPSFRDEEADQTIAIKLSLQAKKLKKHASLRFFPTDDIRNHLRLDHKTGVVQIFHYTSFLKEQLRVTKYIPQTIEGHPPEGLPQETAAAEYVKVGVLPRQLVLEVLDSIQKILFPISDDQSYALLDSLTGSKMGSFDPDCVHFESDFRHSEEKVVSYYYFGSRLMELYQEAENPRPRGLFAEWLERKSGARYVMLATLIGVLIAIFLGLAGLAVSSYQTWIAYQQWKHPVST